MSTPHVFSVTSAKPSLTDDQGARNRQYLVSMSIRVACFLGAVAVEGWLRWTLFVGAVVLPWFAVVIANAGREERAGVRLPMQGVPTELH